MTQAQPRPAAVPYQAAAPPPTGRWLAPMAAVLSLLYTGLGVFWAAGGGGYPFLSREQTPSLLTLLPQWAGATVMAGTAAVGVVAAVMLWRGAGPRRVRPLLAVAVAETVVFAVLCANVAAIIAAGYAIVLFGTPLLVVFLLLGATRTRGTRWLLAALAVALVAVQLTTGLFDLRALRHLAQGIASIPGKVGLQPLIQLSIFALGVAWAALLVRLLRTRRSACLRCGRPAARWTRPEVAARWGRWATIVAALCPMPYALLRFTWLLPDPVMFSAAELDAEPGIRLFGVGLGLVAFGAGVVTLGLIRPWGETWPRWMPFVAGRPVPVKAAVIPGTTAALLLGVGSISWVVTVATNADGLLSELVIPFPLWGASVGLATLAYYLRRRGTCASCGLG